jgi:hypothetical protein
MNATYILELLLIVGIAISTLFLNILKGRKNKSNQIAR